MSYPEGRALAFADGDVLSVLDGTATFEIRFAAAPSAAAAPARLTTTLQACTDSYCLRPASIDLAAAPAVRRALPPSAASRD